jgi:integral membrane protein (TIGR01906 family)
VKTTGSGAASALIALATAVVIVAVSIIPFLTPQWVAFEQGRAEATAWTGFTTDELRTATDAILSDLILGGEFDIEVAATAVLNERERGHMGDVRTVFRGLWVLAIISILILLAASRRRDRSATWRAVRIGSIGLSVGVVVLGVIGLVAFDQLFEIFHQVFFPAGSYLFDPTTDRMVQLFPFRFWEESAIAVGVVIFAICVVVGLVAGRRAATAEPAP